MPRFSARPLPAALFALTCGFAVASVVLSAGLEPAYDTVFYGVNAVALGAAGGLIAWRHPGNAIGWLLSGMGVLAAFTELTEGYGYHLDFPAAVPSQWVSAWMSILGASLTAIVLLLFPTGRPPGPRWRPLVRLGAAGSALTAVGVAFGHSSDSNFSAGSNPYAAEGIRTGIDLVYAAGQACFAVTLLAAVAALVARFRHAAGVERQQLKWIAYVVAVLAVVGPLAIFFYHDSLAVRVAIAVVVPMIPAAICIAILRYRLYDIDLIINRTVVYGALTLLLAAAYEAVALVLGAALGGRHGSAWVTAAATLSAAAAFRPLRAWIQDTVDRRFRRARYDRLARMDAFLEDLRAGRASPETLEETLREVLSRPDLELRYFLPEPAHSIDGQGRELELDDDGRIRTEVARGGVRLAVVIHSGTGSEPDLLEEVLARAGLAIEIARLRAEVNHRLAEVESSRARIVAAGYEERRRLERDLHDGAQQRLVAVGLALRHAQHELGPSEAADSLDEAVGQIGQAITDLRELANGVRPAHLNDGLEVALRDLAGRTPLPVTVRVGAERYPTDVEATAYFVACEALTNTVKHARATGIELQAERLDGQLVVTVRDDGVGGVEPSSGSGLRGLSDRVAAQGGRLAVESPPGRGTTVIVELPCAS